MDHQDWTTVTLKKKVKPNAKPKPGEPAVFETKFNAGKNVQHQVVNAKKIEKQADEEVLTIPKVTRNLQLQLQQARQQKNWTQKQLANACQLPESVIKTYENGSAIPNSQDLTKMGKALGVVLKNK